MTYYCILLWAEAVEVRYRPLKQAASKANRSWINLLSAFRLHPGLFEDVESGIDMMMF